MRRFGRGATPRDAQLIARGSERPVYKFWYQTWLRVSEYLEEIRVRNYNINANESLMQINIADTILKSHMMHILSLIDKQYVRVYATDMFESERIMIKKPVMVIEVQW